MEGLLSTGPTLSILLIDSLIKLVTLFLLQLYGAAKPQRFEMMISVIKKHVPQVWEL